MDHGHDVFLVRLAPRLPSIASYANRVRCDRRRTSARSFDAGESGSRSAVPIDARCAAPSAGKRGEGIGASSTAITCVCSEER